MSMHTEIKQKPEENTAKDSVLPQVQGKLPPAPNEEQATSTSRATLLSLLANYGKKGSDIDPKSIDATPVQKLLAKELGFPGCVAGIFYNEKNGAIKDGVISGRIRTPEQEKGEGVPFSVRAENITKDGGINYTLGGYNINSEKDKQLLPVLLDLDYSRQGINRTLAVSPNKSTVVVIDDAFFPTDGAPGYTQLTGWEVYRNGKKIDSNNVSLKEILTTDGKNREVLKSGPADSQNLLRLDVDYRETAKQGPMRRYNSIEFSGEKLEVRSP